MTSPVITVETQSLSAIILGSVTFPLLLFFSLEGNKELSHHDMSRAADIYSDEIIL